MQKIAISVLLIIILVSTSVTAQYVNVAQDTNIEIREVNKESIVMPPHRTSRVAIASFKQSGTYLKVVYGQPLKQAREIFGAVEPYGQVWRTGANEATEITTTQDILISDKMLKAGTYTLFTVPDKDKWKVMFNSELGQWGAYTYDASNDVLTTEIPVMESEKLYEAFTIKFEETKSGADMIMVWDKTQVTLPLTFN